jgi:hypothetical protein
MKDIKFTKRIVCALQDTYNIKLLLNSDESFYVGYIRVTKAILPIGIFVNRLINLEIDKIKPNYYISSTFFIIENTFFALSILLLLHSVSLYISEDEEEGRQYLLLTPIFLGLGLIFSLLSDSI